MPGWVRPAPTCAWNPGPAGAALREPYPPKLEGYDTVHQCSHIPHPSWPTQQPWEVYRTSCIVPIYRREQMILVRLQCARHGRAPSTSDIPRTPWPEELYPHGPCGETEASVSGPGPDEGLQPCSAASQPWLGRQWADRPEHSGSGSKRPPASEAEEQLGAHYRPEKVEVND